MKILYRIIFVFFAANILNAQQLNGYKLCIDPGHGGHNAANDRHITQVDFWESEGNYGKALHLKEILESMGAEVIVTRAGNDDSDDLALSVRAGIANSNNADYFHSIHSNATGTSNRANFPLILFRGYTDNPVFQEAKDFASTNWEEIYDAKSGVWSYHSKRIAGDWSFYPSWGTSGLGVLRPLAMPGTLSEGSFHDYLPEANRLKKSDYLRHEAWAIARTFLRHYNVAPEPTGIIAGIVRDPAKNVPSNYQPLSGTKDNKQPINFVKATLNPGNRVYMGDEGDNGYYFFDYVDPGEYTLILEEEFHSADTSTITVTAGNSSFHDALLTEIPNYNNPQVLSTFPEDQSTDQSTRDTIEIEFDIRMNELSTQSAFNISPSVSGEFSWADAGKTLLFFPRVPFDQQTEYTVTLSASAQTAYNINLLSEYSFTFTTGTATNSNVVSNYPLDGAEGISNVSELIVQFDTRMNDVTTENAFSIIPTASGSFTWNEDHTEMRFKPSSSYSQGELHTATISTDARTYFGGYLADEFTVSFTTRNKLNLISAYPAEGDTGISKTVMIRMTFEMPVKGATLPGNVLFYDSENNFVQLVVNTNAYSEGYIEFEPRNPLKAGSDYKVVLKEGIGDIENVTFKEEVEFNFKTEVQTYQSGQVISDFESFGGWLQPGESDNTIGIDEGITVFAISGVKHYNGESSGLLEYTFNDANGVCEIRASSPLPIGVKGSTKFGVWVFGDLSGNTLELNIADGNGSTELVNVASLDWSGWKLISLPDESITLSGAINLKGIVIRQVEGAKVSGEIYFDDAQVDYTTPVEDNIFLPKKFTLEQNYPNPFNPTTNIGFSLAEKSSVTLTVFNTLGEVVTRIIDNNEYAAGYYNVEWNGMNTSGFQLPSGIYFYKIETSKFNSVKKMILLR